MQNHDQVGNRARGERLSTLVGVRCARRAAAPPPLSPYVPLLFMGEEYGEIAPFPFFVIQRTRPCWPRCRRGPTEFAAFAWTARCPTPRPSPPSRPRKLVWERGVPGPGHAELLALYRDLIRTSAWGSLLLRPGGEAVRCKS